VGARTTFRGSAVVVVGALLLAFSLIPPWADPDIHASDSGMAALLLPLAGATVLLVAISSRWQVGWPFVYTRVLGACSLVAVFYGVLWDGGRVRFGVLLAGLGAVMIASGSSSALSSYGERPPRTGAD
jgi:hypothetical protein